jgi:hypothetical protein
VGDVEFVYSGVASNWAETRCTVATIRPSAAAAGGTTNAAANASEIALKQPCGWNLVNAPWHPIATSPPAFIENVREHLR